MYSLNSTRVSIELSKDVRIDPILEISFFKVQSKKDCEKLGEI